MLGIARYVRYADRPRRCPYCNDAHTPIGGELGLAFSCRATWHYKTGKGWIVGPCPRSPGPRITQHMERV